MNKTFFLLLAVLTLVASSCGEQAKQVATLHVAAPGMHCDGCTATVEETLAKMSGVDSVYADLDSKDVSVLCDTTVTSQRELEEMIATLGFDTAAEEE